MEISRGRKINKKIFMFPSSIISDVLKVGKYNFRIYLPSCGLFKAWEV
jgi:hypothetical protein